MYIMDDENNFSGHRALCFQFEASCNNQFESVEGKCHVANWNINVLESYYAATKDKLYEKAEPKCQNEEFCCDSFHCKNVNEYCNAIIQALNKSTIWRIKNKNTFNRGNNDINWDRNLNSHKKEARLRHKLWVNYGKPKGNMLHSSMIESKKTYKNAIKCARKEHSEIRT